MAYRKVDSMVDQMVGKSETHLVASTAYKMVGTKAALTVAMMVAEKAEQLVVLMVATMVAP